MISVVVRRTARGFVIKAKGHSELATKGQDILCAAFSALLWATINGVANVCGHKPRIRMRRGLFTISLHNIQSENVNVLIDTFCLAVEELQKKYPSRIKIRN